MYTTFPTSLQKKPHNLASKLEANSSFLLQTIHIWIHSTPRRNYVHHLYFIDTKINMYVYIYIYIIHIKTLFWLVVYLPLWKIWVRQLGWWNSQYIESHKIPWFHSPPTSNVSNNEPPTVYFDGLYMFIPSIHGQFWSETIGYNVNPGLINPKRPFNWEGTI